MRCSKCRAPIPNAAARCPACGAALPPRTDTQQTASSDAWSEPTRLIRVPCPHCGQDLLPGQERCPHCAKPIPLDQRMKMPVFEDLGNLDDLADLGLAVDLQAPTEELPDAAAGPGPAHAAPPGTDPDATREFIPPPLTPPEPPAGPIGTPSPPAATRPDPALADSPTLAIHPGGTPPAPGRTRAALSLSLFLWVGAFVVSATAAFLILRPILAQRRAPLPGARTTPPGEAAVSAATPPSEPVDRQLRLRLWMEREARWSRTLQQRFGTLHVITPYFARVYIDGTLAGVTPLHNFYLPPGRHRIEVRLPDAEPVPPRERTQVRTVEIRPGETVHLELVVRRYGRLYVNSLPWGTVYLDNRRVGVTPYIHTRVPVGTHEVMIRTPDGRVYQQTVVVEENQIVRVGHRFPES